MVTINEIFDIRYGNQFDFSKMELSSDEESINFISRGSTNNGLVGRVKKYNNIEPFDAGLITVTMGGSYLLASFVQPAPFYTAQNIKVLSPKFDMNLQERLFYCAIIQHNRFRYHSHSREANSTFDNLIVPSKEEIPLWISEFPIITNYEAEVHSNIRTFDWGWFKYDEIFNIKKGFYNKKPEESGKGTIPFIGATESNNGITSMHTLEEIEVASKTGNTPNQDTSEKIFPGNCITVSNNGSVGFAFYQEKEFTCSHDVNPLYLKKYTLNKYIAMFLCTLIELEQYRWAYGRKWRPKRMPSSLIKLPITPNGTPDWEFMENYIKSLPYGDRI